ncbi:MAG: ABC transporter permease [Telmatospirillum sp.]|nr:ABC transporter permease [Telmatospirillum sp.]
MTASMRKRIGRRGLVARNWRTLAGAVLVGAVVLGALVGPALLPHDPLKTDFLATLAAPDGRFWLGTDELGRDLLARVATGARVSLLVGSLSVGLALLLGTTIGLLAGYGGPIGDTLLMRAMDVLFAFPSILLALAITAVLGPSLGNVIVAIAVVYTPVFARLARAQVLVVRELAYVEAARAMGFRHGQILFGTILPNVAGPLIVQGSLLFASAIITETYLSFLGLGVQPPQPSWGSMLRDAIGFMEIAPWMAWYPGIAIFVAVLGFNLLGDGLLDRFDPRRA